jgi:NADPH:quinone reductase-like Zn-dependent oxidoreductase
MNCLGRTHTGGPCPYDLDKAYVMAVYATAEAPQKQKPSIPSIMRAAALDRFGGPEVLTIHELPVPTLDANEILIAVHTAGVGSWDADMRDGWWPEGEPSFPLVLGSDGSGTVVDAGPSVRHLAIGDRVYSYSFANPKGGFYAEYVAVAAENAAHIPSTLSMKEAGSAATVGLTALQGIDDALRVKRDEIVIIHGATGGVGSLAIQFAKMRGARVIATARGEDGLQFARRLGADDAVDGHDGDIAAAARRFSSKGVDAVLATVGSGLDRVIDAVRKGGRVAYPNGVEPVPEERPGIEIISYDGRSGVREFEALNEAIDQRIVVVPIAVEFPLDQAARAHQRLAAGHVLGKIVLRVQPD